MLFLYFNLNEFKIKKFIKKRRRKIKIKSGLNLIYNFFQTYKGIILYI